MKKLLRFLSYVAVAAAASAATLFFCVGKMTPEMSKLTQLNSMIQEKFIGEADAQIMGDAAADAMVKSLGDRWSYYISASDYEAYMDQMNNAYVGVGITIRVLEDESGYEILQVAAGGPAEEAGVLVGDILVAVGGQRIAGMNTNDVRDLVKGTKGTYVDMTFLRGGEELTFPVQRRQVTTPVATAKMLENGVGLVTIANFDSRCAQETIDAIKSLTEQGADALIFDVRYNPGGYANELVKVLDYLLPEGELFHTVDYSGKEEFDYSDAKYLDLPMAVLVNGESYSAAEFFAAALSEYEAAVVVGEQTVGKGYFQRTYDLLDGSAVGLSVGKYFTPKGVSLAGVGITPDYEVPVTDEQAAKIYAGQLDPAEDPQILAAMEALGR